MTDFKSTAIKVALKSLFRKKGITYEDIAEQLDCSVPTVKRIMGPEELTLTRLLQLCEIAEVELAELDSMTREASIDNSKFTPEQEKFLSKNRTFFAYLMKLFSGDSPKQIADKYKLTQRSTDKYLVGLENNGLIKVGRGLKVRTSLKAIPHLGKGPLGRVYFEGFIQCGARFFIEVIKTAMAEPDSAKERTSSKFGIHVGKLSKPSYDRWVSEYERLLHELIRTSAYEEKSRPEEELKSVVVMHGHTLLPNDFPHLEILENTTGTIPNIQ